VAVPMNHLWLSIEERNLEAPENGHFACVHLSPREALALACHLMDWAREHLEDMPLLGDFEAIEAFETPEETFILNQSGYPVATVKDAGPRLTFKEFYDKHNSFTWAQQGPQYPLAVLKSVVEMSAAYQDYLATGVEPVPHEDEVLCPCAVCRDWRMAN
jgi:hypothetical protein